MLAPLTLPWAGVLALIIPAVASISTLEMRVVDLTRPTTCDLVAWGDAPTLFTYIAGIFGTNISGAAVYIDSEGQLGTVNSSRRFKHAIKPMDKASEAILSLRPVTFRYNSDTKASPQFGLIAEEVAEVNPNLVVRDNNGDLLTVRYDQVNAMLLNEFLKEHRKVQKLEAALDAVSAQLKEQAAHLQRVTAQIQKVSAQVESSKTAGRVASAD